MEQMNANCSVNLFFKLNWTVNIWIWSRNTRDLISPDFKLTIKWLSTWIGIYKIKFRFKIIKNFHFCKLNNLTFKINKKDGPFIKQSHKNILLYCFWSVEFCIVILNHLDVCSVQLGNSPIPYQSTTIPNIPVKGLELVLKFYLFHNIFKCAFIYFPTVSLSNSLSISLFVLSPVLVMFAQNISFSDF